MAWTYSNAYTQVNDYSAKDALTTGDAEKIILGADIDDELAAMKAAYDSKLDSGSVSSQSEAETGTDTESVMTPQGVQYWGDANGGMVGDIRALADPNADTLLGWDDSAGAVIGYTFGTGIASTAGGAVELSFLGLEDLTDPGDDRIYFWDDSAGLSTWLTPGNGIEISATSLNITDQAATTSNPMILSSGSVDIDLEALTTIEGNALASTDTFLVDDGGTPKGIEYQGMGFIVQSAQTTQTLTASDMNTVMEFDGTATLTLPLNATVALPIGSCIIVVVDHATQEVTVTAAGSVTLNSIFHPGGATAESDTVAAGGTACIIKTAADEWYIAGDITD